MDIKFSRALNSCKLPQIRYASKERLFERLTDLRFLSIDFLNTFLLTYRVFTTAEDVLEALKSVHYNCDRYHQQQQQQQVPARESFSAFANSSLSSLINTAQQPADSEHSQELAKQPEAAAKTPERPQVPPRSAAPAADSLAAKLSEHNRFLLEPGGAHQKRRSTISALTPITGSSSSSLVYLAGQKPSGQVAHLLAPSARTAPSEPPSPLASSHTCSSNLDDADLLTQTLSEDERAGSERTVAVNDRTRSSSMTNARPTLLLAGDTSGGGSGAQSSSLHLDVPSCRQVRASSLSHVPVTVSVTRSADAQSQHWRLSYKKMAAQALPARNYLNAASKSARRASSSDVNVTFHVKLDPPPVEARNSSQESSLEETGRQLLEGPATGFVVPPPSPIELALSRSGTGSGSSDSLSSNSQSQSSAGTKSVLTSQSESELIQSSELNSEDEKHRAKLQVNHNGLRARKGSNECRRGFVMKEIELTESKTLDCDTSADEDKVSTSSGDQSHADLDSEEEAQTSNKNEDDDEEEDDKSFKLLTRLNSVQMKKSRLENDFSDSDDFEKRALIKSIKGKRRLRYDKSNASTADARAKRRSAAEKARESNCKPAEEESRRPENGGGGVVERPKSEAAAAAQQQQQQASRATPESVNAPEWASSRTTTPRSSFQHHPAEGATAGGASKAGVIVSSSSPRVSSRRSSTASAASAFAAATAASNNPILTQPPASMKSPLLAAQARKLSELALRHNSEALMQAAAGEQQAIQCLCNNFHRASISSPTSSFQQPVAASSLYQHRLSQVRPSDLPDRRNALHSQAGAGHYPSCIYFQPHTAASPSNTPSTSYPNAHSDASSLCNSRASSRLSSCAGLESSSYSANFYSAINNQQQAINNQRQQQTLGRQTIATSASASTPTRSKRNSAQINVRSVATIRVLSVLRHWVSKHSQDFINDTKLAFLVQDFLQDLIMDSNLLPAEHKAALQLQQMVQKAAHSRGSQVDLDLLLAAPAKASPDSIETLSALEIAEGMTYIDHKIFLAIRSEEFLGQAWMKMDKAIKAPHILLITKRFNDVSRLVSSEIIRVPELQRRVAIIEKWTNVAHICRVVHNFNGVLQICAAFTNSAVFRLKKTWDKIPKTTKTTIDQLQSLVSTDSRFRNMRDAINRCDPPSIPYVGMYLTDLSFIEEGTPNYSPDGLLNFSKMRMIAHVIREIQHLQNGSYKIELNHKVANYLLDASRHLQDDEMYRCSLAIEPRSSGAKNGVQILNNMSQNGTPIHNQASNANRLNQNTHSKS